MNMEYPTLPGSPASVVRILLANKVDRFQIWETERGVEIYADAMTPELDAALDAERPAGMWYIVRPLTLWRRVALWFRHKTGRVGTRITTTFRGPRRW